MLSFIKEKWLKACLATIATSLILLFLLTFLDLHLGTSPSIFLVYLASSAPFLILTLIVCHDFRKYSNTANNILDNIDDGIIIKDEQGCFLYCNKAVADFYNTTVQEMLGKSDESFNKNTDQTNFFRDHLQSILGSFEKQEVQQSVTNVNTGKTYHFNAIKIPFKNSRNEKNVFILAKNITQIKADSDRKESRLKKVLDASEECLWEWNVQTNEVRFNRQWVQLTGIPESETAFEDFDNAIHDEDKPIVHSAIQTLIEKNTPFNIEFKMNQPNGNVIWVWDRARIAEYDDHGKPLWIVGITLDITQSKLAQKKIENLAYYDQLTGLANRTTLENELKKVTECKKQSESYSGLVFIDLDRFKLLNDSYGHFMGDILLKTIATRLTSMQLKGATITRFGGDEFAILLPFIHSDHQEAVKFTKQAGDAAIAEISKTAQLQSEGNDGLTIEYTITASAGGIVFKEDDISSSEALQLADMALYRAKADGGDRASVFDINMQESLRKNNELSLAMHNSVINRDFCIYLQPKQNQNEQLIGAEALVRWVHPKLGVLAPDAFIKMAEETNAILPIGNLVLERSCEQLKLWQLEESTQHLQLSVNLSAKQIWQSTFYQDIINIVEAYDIDHSKLILEVTESVLIQDVNDATEKLEKLRNYGIRISLDDFGTGYSSLNYLRSLPLDEIKIDRSFIQDVAQDTQAQVMVKSILDLAESFHLKVVSEGVETREQIEVLRKLGNTFYQGYFFSKPLPINEFHEKYLKNKES
ncbi:EAL domain-containing protein [Marinomonas sp. C2222]|uniref:EAL domain-containing protein n=1 Tax=Marinomonas sargassi TaxID=2984494 RepID=A0ABT2YU54_9GAMM|nr:EAL domain-containing protein [Marinomonas sargassi]MCV2403418.1 EAL domain-containing protein [Marinomonas sargassi]